MTGYERIAAAMNVLALGNRDLVEKKTQALVEIFSDTPRFVLNAGCAIPADTPKENIRAMISWAAPLALTGFRYSAVDRTLAFASNEGNFFWSNGYAYGTILLKRSGHKRTATVKVIKGQLAFKSLTWTPFGEIKFKTLQILKEGESKEFEVPAVKIKAE